MVKTYLAGPIDGFGVDKARQWRDDITDCLKKIGVETLNPLGINKDRLDSTRKNLLEWTVFGEVQKIRKFVASVVIPPDIDMVEQCDFITLHIPENNVEICGSYGEMTLGVYLHKPVYIITNRSMKPIRIPKWAIGCSSEVFTTWESYLKFISDNW